MKMYSKMNIGEYVIEGKRWMGGEFPGDPVLGLRYTAVGPGSFPGRGTKISTSCTNVAKKKKKSVMIKL